MIPPLIKMPILWTEELFYFPSFVLIFYMWLITHFNWLYLFNLSRIFSYSTASAFIALVQIWSSMPEKRKIRHVLIYRTPSGSWQNAELKNTNYTENGILGMKSKQTLNVIIIVHVLFFPFWKILPSIM